MTGRSAGPRAASRSESGIDPAAYVAEALREPIPADRILIATIPAPAASPEAALGSAEGDAVFWSLPGGSVHVGLGVAHTVRATGPHRFHDVRVAAERLWTRVLRATHPAAAPLAPRLFGGFSFLPGPLTAEWEAFGEATFVLPRLLYTVDESGHRLSVAVTASERDRRGAAAIADDVRRLFATLARAEPSSGSDAVGRPSPASAEPARESGAGAGNGRADRGERADWGRAVASIQRRIEAGVGDKVVAARRHPVVLASAPDLAAVVARLGRESSTAARFAFRLDDGAFVGATPERLVGRTGRMVQTEALAGTIPAGRREEERRLMDSVKDSAEHGYVVHAIADALAPLCERLDYPDEPRIQRLRHVVHLQTPFVGRLREPVHVLDLVARLHPTPAVGGWPTSPAVEWIRTEEPGSRGWYAAPVGWFDGEGDGEFGVALRSALLQGDRAHLFAGAGIVRDSDAEAEFDETVVKLRTMLDALGLGPGS